MNIKISELQIINPGAIGISNDNDVRAGYGILKVDKKIEYQQRNIEYSFEKYISELKRSNMPYKDMLAEQIKTGEPNKSLFRQC
jgi:hypothetical protein